MVTITITGTHRDILIIPSMTLLLSLWLLSAIILHCSTSLTVAKEVFVTPSDNVNCSFKSPCLTLNEYAREADKYFVNNTKFIFLPGVHYLDVQVSLENLSNVTFLGSYEVEVTQILFNHRSKITRTNCMNVRVSDFVININGLAESEKHITAGLEFHKTRSILSNVTVFGNTTFRAIFVNDWSEVSVNNLHISGASSDEGSALFAMNSIVNFCGSNSFINNSATCRGGAIALNNCITNINGNTVFINNTATMGGAIFILNGNYSVSGNISFIEITAFDEGGAIELYSCTSNFVGNIFFINNAARWGGAMTFYNGNLSISGNISFIKNSATSVGGAVDLEKGTLVMSGDISFINNTCTDCKGGAVAVYGYDEGGDTSLNLTGLIRFKNNSANQGGAMAFIGKPRLLLSDPLKMDFIENHSDSTGGAISFVENGNQCVDPHSRPRVDKQMICLIEFSSETNIHLNFHNNTAGDAGTVLYRGALDSCKLYTGGGVRDSCGNIVGGSYSYHPLRTIRSISNITSRNGLTSDISSDPDRVCFCKDNGNLVCDAPAVVIKTVTGRKFTLKAVIVGQDKGIVPSSVRISLDNDVQINASQRIQQTGKECTELAYRLFSGFNSTTVSLFPDSGTCRGIEKLYINVTLKFLPCPDTFILRGSECVCEDRLQQFNVTCNVDNNSIERTSNSFWMVMVYENKTYIGLIINLTFW